MRYCFGDIVVVENNLIGVVVKSWITSKSSIYGYNKQVKHEVYVRMYNEIREYPEDTIQRYMVRHKYLDDEELVWQDNAITDNIDYLNIIDNIKEESKFNYEEQNNIKYTKPGWNTLLYTILFIEDTNADYNISKTRVYNGLRRAHIEYLGDFLQTLPSDLLTIRNLGKKSLSYIIPIILNYCDKNNIDIKYDLSLYENLYK